MERIQSSTVTRQFKRTFGQGTLNELGRMARFCRRERVITPFRLALSLIVALAFGWYKSVVEAQRTNER